MRDKLQFVDANGTVLIESEVPYRANPGDTVTYFDGTKYVPWPQDADGKFLPVEFDPGTVTLT